MRSLALLGLLLSRAVPLRGSTNGVNMEDPNADDEIKHILSRHEDAVLNVSASNIDAWGEESRGAWRARTDPLPLCAVSCEDVRDRSVILPPLSSRGHGPRSERAGVAYNWTCWALKHTYHVAPACARGLGSLPAEEFSWSLEAALALECRLPEFSPAEAARTGLRARGRLDAATGLVAAGARPMTVMLFGSSISRQLLEAMLCRWSGELSGGWLNAETAAWPTRGSTIDVAAARADGGTCHGTASRNGWEALYPRATHGVAYAPPQRTPACSDNFACVEFGGVLRLCYSYYGLRWHELGKKGASKNASAANWPFCEAGGRVEDVDLLVAEQGDAVLADETAALFGPDFASCRRGAPRAGPAGRAPYATLHFTSPLGLRDSFHARVLGALGEYATDAAYARAACSRHGGALCPAVPMKPGYDFAIISNPAPKSCDAETRGNAHPHLPGAPDLYAQAVLAMIATSQLRPGETARCEPK